MRRLAPTLVVLCALGAHAENPAPAPPSTPKKLVGTKKVGAPKLDLGLPKFDALPKDQQLVKPKADEDQTTPAAPRPEDAYQVLQVTHAKSFLHGPDGAKPAAPLAQVLLTGTPPRTTEKFTSVVRLKAPSKRSVHIEVAILDPRGDAVMDAEGEVGFDKALENEWEVDWLPTTVRFAGDYQVQVKVDGKPMSTTAIKFTETQK